LLMVLFQRPKRRRLGFYRFKFWIMRVVAVGTEIIGPFASDKVSCPLPMDARLPISIDVAMTLSAESIALGEIDQFSVEKPEFVPIFGLVAVEAPSHGLGMVKLDVRVFFLELPPLPIDLHGSMAVAAGKDPFRKGRRGDWKLLHRHGSRNKIDRHEKDGYA